MRKISFIILFLLIAQTCFGATQLLKTVMPSGGDYTTLEACMNANEQNLVTADKYFDVEIDGTWSSADTTAVTIHNYTTDATRYINIYTTTAARHNAIANGTGYHLSQNGYLVDTLNNSISFVTINGLKITSGNGSYRDAIVSTGASCVIKNNLIPLADRKGINCESSGSVTIYNNFVCRHGWAPEQSIYFYGDSTYLAYNNTVRRSIEFGTSGGTATAKNNYASTYVGTWAGGFTTNAAANTTGDPAGLDSIAFNTSTFVNVTSGTEDLHLVAGAALIDAGTDLSATFTTDIDGTTRTGTWDVGADEYVAAAGAVSQIISGGILSGALIW